MCQFFAECRGAHPPSTAAPVPEALHTLLNRAPEAFPLPAAGGCWYVEAPGWDHAVWVLHDVDRVCPARRTGRSRYAAVSRAGVLLGTTDDPDAAIGLVRGRPLPATGIQASRRPRGGDRLARGRRVRRRPSGSARSRRALGRRPARVRAS